MNKEELLNKAKEIDYNNLPLLKGIYIIQQRRLHDSGFRLMYIIGHSEYKKDIKDFEYYMISCCSDVVDFEPIFSKLLNRNYDMCDLHLDINKNGLIHIWTNSDKWLITDYLNLSNCTIRIANTKREFLLGEK
jgi:hypothetical protein